MTTALAIITDALRSFTSYLTGAKPTVTPLAPRCVVDVSHYQKPTTMDWISAKKAGIVGVIIKATQGASWEDPAFFDHMHYARAAGIPLLGAYHFLTDEDPDKQAQRFLDTVATYVGLSGILLALDLEANSMGHTETVTGAAAVSDAIFHRIGRRPVLYTGIYGPSGTGAGLPNPVLSTSDLWLPKYGTNLRLPKGWAELPYAGRMGGAIRLWQQTDGILNNGKPVLGLGHVDQSSAMGFKSLEELSAWWGK